MPGHTFKPKNEHPTGDLERVLRILGDTTAPQEVLRGALTQAYRMKAHPSALHAVRRRNANLGVNPDTGKVIVRTKERPILAPTLAMAGRTALAELVTIKDILRVDGPSGLRLPQHAMVDGRQARLLLADNLKVSEKIRRIVGMPVVSRALAFAQASGSLAALPHETLLGALLKEQFEPRQSDVLDGTYMYDTVTYPDITVVRETCAQAVARQIPLWDQNNRLGRYGQAVSIEERRYFAVAHEWAETLALPSKEYAGGPNPDLREMAQDPEVAVPLWGGLVVSQTVELAGARGA